MDRLVYVDAADRVIDHLSRQECHGNPEKTHRVVHVWVTNSQGMILAQKRTDDKDIQPGKWDTAVGGHVAPDEDYRAAAIREFTEELGVAPDQLRESHSYLWVSDVESERVKTYLSCSDGPFQPDPSEVAELKFYSIEQLKLMAKGGEITPNMRFELTIISNSEEERQIPATDYPIQEICRCDRCDRLVRYRSGVTPPRVYQGPKYWNKPVPGFGDLNARLLIVGLAPGAHGANRTGRAFTGDSAGDVLYRALHTLGLSNNDHAVRRGDGLVLTNTFISNAVKCVPPDNRPVADEINTCRDFLRQELRALHRVGGIIALGGQAFQTVMRLWPEYRDKLSGKRPVFKHGEIFDMPVPGLKVLAVYHPSRRNINTGRLTYDEFLSVLRGFTDDLQLSETA